MPRSLIFLTLLVASCAQPPDTGSGSFAYPGPSSQTVCAHYLACLGVAAPEQVSADLATYGTAGSCWKAPPNEQKICGAACASGLKKLHLLAPGEPACAECRDDFDCSPGAPSCAQDSHTCAECSKDSQCHDPALPACDTASHKCVACTEDADCTGAGHNACDPISHACVQCTVAAHCTMPGLSACDSGQHVCVACVQDATCTDPGLPGCDVKTHSCVACTHDSHCQGATPVCDTKAFSCVGCAKDKDCSGGGVCQLGTCCTPNCTGKTCGPDGCGGYCGDGCPGSKCTAKGKCSPCLSDPDCGKGQFCYTGQDKATKCFTECNVFDPGVCGPDTSCHDVGYDFAYHIFVQCSAAGSIPAYGTCTTKADCADGTICMAPGYCAPFCDDNHPCKGGSGKCVAWTFEGVPQKYKTCAK